MIADSTANPAFVAADLLSQAEHGVDSQVVLVAVDLTEEHLTSIEDEVDKQAKALSRVDIIRESVGKSIIVKASSLEEGLAFSNDYAPEHLILHIENAQDAVARINNAGSVFVGSFTPERFVLTVYSAMVWFTTFLAAEIMLLGPTIHCRQMATLGNSAASIHCRSKNISLRKKSVLKVCKSLGRPLPY